MYNRISAMPRGYTNTRRTRQAAQTRAEIAAALVSEVAAHGLAYSLQAVADRAGVALRTVSLHFPDRAAQLAAVTAELEARGPSEANPASLGDLPALAARLAHAMFADPALLRAEVAVGRPRRARDQAIARALAKQTEPAIARSAAAALSVVLSPDVAVALLDRHKLDPAAAETVVTWVVQVLVDAIRNGDVPAATLKRTRRS